MRYLTGLCLLALFFSCSNQNSSNAKDIADIQAMEQRLDGSFDVTCQDGTDEIRTDEELRRGEVCHGANDLVCANFNGAYFPTRISDSEPLGNYGTNSRNCQEIVRAARSNVVCANFNGSWYPTRIPDEKALGDYGAIETQCTLASRNAHSGQVCANFNGSWYPTRISDGQPIGQQGSPLENCIR